MRSGKGKRHKIHKPIHKGRIVALALLVLMTAALAAACGENPKNDAAGSAASAEGKAAYEKGETEVRTDRKGQEIVGITYSRSNGMVYNEDFTAVITASGISYARFFCEDGTDGDYIELSETAIEAGKWSRLEAEARAALPYLEEQKQSRTELLSGILKKTAAAADDGGDASRIFIIWKKADGAEQGAEYRITDEAGAASLTQLTEAVVRDKANAVTTSSPQKEKDSTAN